MEAARHQQRRALRRSGLCAKRKAARAARQVKKDAHEGANEGAGGRELRHAAHEVAGVVIDPCRTGEACDERPHGEEAAELGAGGQASLAGEKGPDLVADGLAPCPAAPCLDGARGQDCGRPRGWEKAIVGRHMISVYAISIQGTTKTLLGAVDGLAATAARSEAQVQRRRRQIVQDEIGRGRQM